jgi:hypothetical protein
VAAVAQVLWAQLRRLRADQAVAVVVPQTLCKLVLLKPMPEAVVVDQLLMRTPPAALVAVGVVLLVQQELL